MKYFFIIFVIFRFSMYPPSMLSSAALAHSAQQLEKRSLCRQFNVNQLIRRLQILTRVENVSLALPLNTGVSLMSVWCLIETTCLHRSSVTCQVHQHRPTDNRHAQTETYRDIDRYICDVWCDVIWCVSYFIWDQFDQKIGGSCRPVIFRPDKISPIAGSTLLYSKCCFSRFLFFINCVVSQGDPRSRC